MQIVRSLVYELRCLDNRTDKASCITWRQEIYTEHLVQGWRNFIRALGQNGYKIGRNTFACPREFWGAKLGLRSLHNYFHYSPIIIIIIIIIIIYLNSIINS